MKALDTNVIVHFLVKDDPHQAGQVYDLLREAARIGFFAPVP